MADLPDVRDGDLAFAWNVENIADVLEGKRAMNVRLTRHSHAVDPTLKLANLNAAGPILELVDGSSVGAPRVMMADRTGWRQFAMNGFMDLKYQGVAPSAPGASTGILRMYVRAGQLYFKAEGSGELQIPVGTPPGPMVRHAFWMGG